MAGAGANGTATEERGQRLLMTSHALLPQDPGIPLLGFYPKAKQTHSRAPVRRGLTHPHDRTVLSDVKGHAANGWMSQHSAQGKREDGHKPSVLHDSTRGSSRKCSARSGNQIRDCPGLGGRGRWWSHDCTHLSKLRQLYLKTHTFYVTNNTSKRGFKRNFPQRKPPSLDAVPGSLSQILNEGAPWWSSG